jgi:hypothetical protein
MLVYYQFALILCHNLAIRAAHGGGIAELTCLVQLPHARVSHGAGIWAGEPCSPQLYEFGRLSVANPHPDSVDE